MTNLHLLGMTLKLNCISGGITDAQLFDDAPFWNLPEEGDRIEHHSEESTHSKISLFEANISVSKKCKYKKEKKCIRKC